MQVKHQAVMETMGRLLHVNQELSRTILGLVPDQGHPVHRDSESRLGSVVSIPAGR